MSSLRCLVLIYVCNAFETDSDFSACFYTKELNSKFLSTCLNILDTVAPLKARRPQPKSEPWLNDSTRAARQERRRAERKWKKDKLHVSYEILKVSWSKYKETV